MAKKRRAVRAVKKKAVEKKPKIDFRSGVKLALNKFFLFLGIFVFSLVMYKTISDEFYNELFYILSVFFGSLSGAFAIVLLIFFFLSLMKKRR